MARQRIHDGIEQRIRILERESIKAKLIEEELKTERHKLGERIKELKCLYGLSELTEKHETSLDGILQGMVDLLPQGWQYPDITQSRIILEGDEYTSKGFKEGKWRQAANIVSHGRKIGIVEIFYLKDMPKLDEGPFLKEERKLINAFAERLGKIIEHKQAEKALQLSEAKYRTLTERMNDIIWTTDLDFKVTYMSPSVEKIVGFTPEECMHMPPWDTITPESFTRATNILNEELLRDQKECVDPERTVTFEMEDYHKDGSTVWVECVVSAIRDNTGKMIGLHGVSRNINERKQVEKALRESEENFRMFFETMDDIILVGSQDGKILYANPAVLKKLGYSQGELKEMHILDMHPTEVRQEAEEIFSYMFKGEMDICPLPLQSKIGTLIPVETRVWFGKWNGMDCIFGLCKDLSKEQEALQKFNRLFRHNPAPMALNTLPDRRFVDINDAFLRTLGYSKEEVIGKTSEELNIFRYPEMQKHVAELLQEQGSITNQELQVKCKDGIILDGIFSGDIIESQGERFFLTVMIDETKRKRAERAIRESESKFRTLFESAKDAILLLDQEIIIDCNPKALDMLACTREQIIGQTPSLFSPEFQADGKDIREEVQKKAADALKGQTQFFEWDFIRFDGSLHYAEVSLNSFVVADKSYLLAIARDVTERKKNEMELKQYQEQLEVMVRLRTAELTKAYEQLKLENDIRKTTEVELNRRRQELEEMNTALRVILKQREEDKATIEMNVLSNHKVSILPYLDLLERTNLDDDQKTFLSIIKANLEIITSTFSKKISSGNLGLTANEQKVASLIKEGKTSKEIADLLNISITTVNAYRRKIRSKTDLRNKDINLRSYLQSL